VEQKRRSATGAEERFVGQTIEPFAIKEKRALKTSASSGTSFGTEI
jgi:hypothetical protein